jgi:hypothetical protein
MPDWPVDEPLEASLRMTGGATELVDPQWVQFVESNYFPFIIVVSALAIYGVVSLLARRVLPLSMTGAPRVRLHLRRASVPARFVTEGLVDAVRAQAESEARALRATRSGSLWSLFELQSQAISQRLAQCILKLSRHEAATEKEFRRATAAALAEAFGARKMDRRSSELMSSRESIARLPAAPAKR